MSTNPVWAYSGYRATLRRNGAFFALVTPDGKAALSPPCAEELVRKLNDGEAAGVMRERLDALPAAQLQCCCAFEHPVNGDGSAPRVNQSTWTRKCVLHSFHVTKLETEIAELRLKLSETQIKAGLPIS